MDSMNSTHMRRRGFSLIELLVVIGLIALLGTLTIIGIGRMQTHGKQQQTRLILQNLQAMFAEYDVNRRIPFGAGNVSTNVAGGLSGFTYLAAPQDVSSTGSDRTGNAVQYTRFFMAQMMSIPSNATAMGKLPSASVMTFVGTNLPSNNTWAAGNTYHVFDFVDYTDAFGNKNVYVRSQISVDSNGNIQPDGPQDAPPNPYFWLPGFTVIGNNRPATPVILDAWGNPIIFVMGGVLGAPSGSTSGILTAGGSPFQAHSSDYHPFFASAGPDGDFSKGDDNLYSYEK